MSPQKTALISIFTFITFLFFETIGRENDIPYFRITKLIKPLSFQCKYWFARLRINIAYYLGQPLLYLWDNLADLLEHYAKEMFQSFCDVLTPTIVIILSPIHIIMGYLEQGDQLIRYYIGD